MIKEERRKKDKDKKQKKRNIKKGLKKKIYMYMYIYEVKKAVPDINSIFHNTYEQTSGFDFFF
jgi:hypothetical protein